MSNSSKKFVKKNLSKKNRHWEKGRKIGKKDEKDEKTVISVPRSSPRPQSGQRA